MEEAVCRSAVMDILFCLSLVWLTGSVLISYTQFFLANFSFLVYFLFPLTSVFFPWPISFKSSRLHFSTVITSLRYISFHKMSVWSDTRAVGKREGGKWAARLRNRSCVRAD